MAKIKSPVDVSMDKLASSELKCDKKDSFHLEISEADIQAARKQWKRDNTKKKTPKIKNIQIISSLAMFLLKKCWMTCSAAVFIIFVIYLCYGGIVAFILFLFALSGFIFQVGDFFLYHPEQPPQSRLYVPLPSLFGLPAESVFIKTSDGVKIHAFFIKQDSSIISQVPTILYLHGNAGNIGHRLPNAQGLYQFCGCNILLLEYRGYGHSEGAVSEEGLYLDAQAGLKFLLQVPYIDKSKLVVFGRSLGGAVAIDLVSQPDYGRHVLALIAENTFTGIPAVARSMFAWKWLNWLPTWAFKNQFLSLKKVKMIKRPSLFISGLADVVIPPWMMKALFESCACPLKRLQTIDNGTHNETWQCKGYYRIINLFVDDMIMAERDLCDLERRYEGGGEIY